MKTKELVGIGYMILAVFSRFTDMISQDTFLILMLMTAIYLKDNECSK